MTDTITGSSSNGDWVLCDDFNMAWINGDAATTCTTANTTNYVVSMYGTTPFEPEYKGGTKLLRDAAQRAEDYCWKKARSRHGWKTRRELRDV